MERVTPRGWWCQHKQADVGRPNCSLNCVSMLENIPTCQRGSLDAIKCEMSFRLIVANHAEVNLAICSSEQIVRGEMSWKCDGDIHADCSCGMRSCAMHVSLMLRIFSLIRLCPMSTTLILSVVPPRYRTNM